MTARLVQLITELEIDTVLFYVFLFHVHVGSQYRKASIILAYLVAVQLLSSDILEWLQISCIIGPSYKDIFREKKLMLNFRNLNNLNLRIPLRSSLWSPLA